MIQASLYLNLFSTIFMVGLIWFVQIVHYPMFKFVGETSFVEYERIHQQLTTYVVGPAMLIEAATAVALLWLRPTGVYPGLLWVGLFLLLIIWGVTAGLSVPAHERLSQGFNTSAHNTLVQTNWIRTVAWSLRGVLGCMVLYQFSHSG